MITCCSTTGSALIAISLPVGVPSEPSAGMSPGASEGVTPVAEGPGTVPLTGDCSVGTGETGSREGKNVL